MPQMVVWPFMARTMVEAGCSVKTSARFSKFVIHRGTFQHELPKPEAKIVVPIFDLKFLTELAAADAEISNRRY